MTAAVGFVGSSGTGKSYRATWVAAKNGIDYIIDDGLLINGGRVLAGSSAKKEPTKLASVRRALFMDKKHAESVKGALLKSGAQTALILGTSEQMIERIAETLGLAPVASFIHIEEIASPEEISLAVSTRREQGKHVIPVPTFEVKKDFSGYFIDTLKIFLGTRKKRFIGEKTVVRPAYSYMGEYHISDKILSAICKKAAEENSGVRTVRAAVVYFGADGVTIDMDIVVMWGNNFRLAALEAQRAAAEKIEELTGINVLGLNVTVKAVDF